MTTANSKFHSHTNKIKNEKKKKNEKEKKVVEKEMTGPTTFISLFSHMIIFLGGIPYFHMTI